MDSLKNFVRGVFSLGMGCPYYRHSSEEEVPWPHIDNPLRNPSPETLRLWSQAVGGREIREEVRRLGLLRIPEEEYRGTTVSNFLYKPARVTYTTHVPFKEFPLQKKSETELVWRVCDPSLNLGTNSAPLPGYAFIREIRIRGDIRKIRRVDLKLGSTGKLVQTLEHPHLIAQFLKTTLGICSITITNEDWITLPLFFSRDPSYALPMFVVGDLELTLHTDPETPLRLYATLDLLHNEEEIRQIQRSHAHRVEDLDVKSPWNVWEIDRWLYMGCFWRFRGRFTEETRIKIDYEGGLDEEIRGIFWEILDDKPPPEIGVGYAFDDPLRREIFLSDPLPEPALSELELRTKIIPTLSGSRYIPRSERGGRGGILFSRNADGLDCEPGLTPRNGTLFLSLSRETTLNVFLLTSRDVILTKYGKSDHSLQTVRQDLPNDEGL
jgi:hypothetical protein